MSDGAEVVASLRQRLNGDGEIFSLLDAIDAFEASYRHDRFSGEGDSLILVGWPIEGDNAIFDLALARSIGGEIFEFPTIVTARIQISIGQGERFDSAVDERFPDAAPWPGHIHLHCDDYSAADAFFTRLRRLTIVQRYGMARPVSCELSSAGDDQLRDIAGKLADYFAEHGCPSTPDCGGKG